MIWPLKEAIMSSVETDVSQQPSDLQHEAHRISCVLQSLSERLPKAHPSRTLLEDLADAISDALETQ